ncbi:hypothetical protein HIM_04257 [Hirsutella minnesotensis 3608]|uniref:Uncharacterized protein n=1 Tax=Hirsutella minnesotensis 3608 TaxID=1043627 RepID=A0A0F7ZVF6_9HYPO|nr:hypothetical protein HIM_04257 [Hirsutella minnesotensis 3608]
MPEVFHQTFQDLSTSLEEEGVHLIQCDPNYCVWFADNDCFDLSTNLPKMAKQIERHEGRLGFECFLSFMQESRKHYDFSMVHVLSSNSPQPLSMLRDEFLLKVPTMHPFGSIYSRVGRI